MTRWYWLVALLGVCGLLIPVQLYLAIPLGEPIAASFGASGSGSWVAGTFAAAYALGFLVFGVVSDRLGRRPVLVWGAVALAASTALVAVAPSFGVLLALRVVQGIAAATFAPAALACVVDVAPARHRVTALTCVTTGLIGSAVVGQVFGELTGPAWGWRSAVAVAAGAYLVLAVALAWLVPAARAATAAAVPLRAAYGRMAVLARQAPLRSMFVVGLTVFGTLVVLSAILRVRLDESFGLSHGEVVAVEAVGLLGIALAPFANAFSGRFGAKRVVVVAFLTAVAGTGLQAAAGSVAVLAFGVVVFMAGIAVANPALVALISAWAPAERGAAVAFNTFVLFAGATLGAFLPDVLSDGAAYAVVGCVLLGAAVLIATTVPRGGATSSLQLVAQPLHFRRTPG